MCDCKCKKRIVLIALEKGKKPWQWPNDLAPDNKRRRQVWLQSFFCSDKKFSRKFANHSKYVAQVDGTFSNVQFSVLEKLNQPFLAFNDVETRIFLEPRNTKRFYIFNADKHDKIWRKLEFLIRWDFCISRSNHVWYILHA